MNTPDDRETQILRMEGRLSDNRHAASCIGKSVLQLEKLLADVKVTRTKHEEINGMFVNIKYFLDRIGDKT